MFIFILYNIPFQTFLHIKRSFAKIAHTEKHQYPISFTTLPPCLKYHIPTQNNNLIPPKRPAVHDYKSQR